MKKLLITLLLIFFVPIVNAQVYCYEYLYNVNDDGVKIKTTLNSGACFYFTFNNNKSKCYMTNSDGVFSGMSALVYQYIGQQNGMYIYRDNFKLKGDYSWLYFSTDFTKLNWITGYNDEAGTIRVLQYTQNPQKKNYNVPKQLY